MIEVHPDLFVGSMSDLPNVTPGPNWYVIHAAKEPWHRMALGYTERAAPKDHPSYLAHFGPDEMAMNLVDAPDPAYIPEELMRAAVLGMHLNLPNRKVLVHCNQGLSRAPTIAMLYLREHTDLFEGMDYDQAVTEFTSIYPGYAPAGGMAGYARAHWGDA